jgi:hypothetical protein
MHLFLSSWVIFIFLQSEFFRNTQSYVVSARISHFVEDFGAVGDGVHDDAEAFRLALLTNRSEAILLTGFPEHVESKFG